MIKFLLIGILLLHTLFVNEYKPFIATAYSLKGRTASGEMVRTGIIAADPKVLKMHSKVNIKGLGDFVVKDTGGKIKGNKIDIWMPTRKQAIKFGVQKVILKKL